MLKRKKPQAKRTVKVKAERAPINWTLIASALVAAVVIGLASMGMQWLADPNNLPIRSVRIEGEFQHLSAEQLQTAVADKVVGGFFTVDVNAVMQAAQTLPWTHTVSVRRVWPDTLSVTVTEQVPLARWGKDELLNRDGQRFKPDPATLPEGLPQLHGPDGLEKSVVASYYEMGKALAAVGLRIQRLTQDQRRSWRIGLDNGVELVLGRQEVHPRLLRFVRLYMNVLAPRVEELNAVDLRYTNGFAVSWKTAPVPGNGQRAPERRG